MESTINMTDMSKILPYEQVPCITCSLGASQWASWIMDLHMYWSNVSKLLVTSKTMELQAQQVPLRHGESHTGNDQASEPESSSRSSHTCLITTGCCGLEVSWRGDSCSDVWFKKWLVTGSQSEEHRRCHMVVIRSRLHSMKLSGVCCYYWVGKHGVMSRASCLQWVAVGCFEWPRCWHLRSLHGGKYFSTCTDELHARSWTFSGEDIPFSFLIYHHNLKEDKHWTPKRYWTPKVL